MSTQLDIEYWTEEYRKCKEIPGYLIRNYVKVIESDGTLRKLTEEEVEKAMLFSGDSVSADIPEGLKAGCFNYESRVANDGRSVQRIINRLLSQIQHEESKKKP